MVYSSFYIKYPIDAEATTFATVMTDVSTTAMPDVTETGTPGDYITH